MHSGFRMSFRNRTWILDPPPSAFFTGAIITTLPDIFSPSLETLMVMSSVFQPHSWRMRNHIQPIKIQLILSPPFSCSLFLRSSPPPLLCSSRISVARLQQISFLDDCPLDSNFYVWFPSTEIEVLFPTHSNSFPLAPSPFFFVFTSGLLIPLLSFFFMCKWASLSHRPSILVIMLFPLNFLYFSLPGFSVYSQSSYYPL